MISLRICILNLFRPKIKTLVLSYNDFQLETKDRLATDSY